MVDEVASSVEENLGNANLIASIDHGRLAIAADSPMSASTVIIFSDAEFNSRVLAESITAGLDLPFRVLAYDDNGTAMAAYSSADFMRRRHAIKDDAIIAAYQAKMQNHTQSIPPEHVQAVPEREVAHLQGVIALQSDFSLDETIQRLKSVVTGQGDTVWFGSIDYRAEAENFDISLPPSQLLLFGAPAPGGLAMNGFPLLGLDAFCQKLLVYKDDNGEVLVLFNDIAAMAELHYGRSAKPHLGINGRLTQTFRQAIEKQDTT